MVWYFSSHEQLKFHAQLLCTAFLWLLGLVLLYAKNNSIEQSAYPRSLIIDVLDACWKVQKQNINVIAKL